MYTKRLGDQVAAQGIMFEEDKKKKIYIVPKKILWKTKGEQADVQNEQILLQETSGQITFNGAQVCTLVNHQAQAGILIDFGIEVQGGVQILVHNCGGNKQASIRVRFGESAMEAMSEIEKSTATNDHAIRD